MLIIYSCWHYFFCWYFCAWLWHLLSWCFFVCVFWLCLDSQSTMNSCGPGLYTIIMLCRWIHSNILWSPCDKLITSFWILPPAAYGLLSCSYHGWNRRDGIFQGHAVCLGLLLQCCYIPGFSAGQAFVHKCYLTKHSLVNLYLPKGHANVVR